MLFPVCTVPGHYTVLRVIIYGYFLFFSFCSSVLCFCLSLRVLCSLRFIVSVRSVPFVLFVCVATLFFIALLRSVAVVDFEHDFFLLLLLFCFLHRGMTCLRTYGTCAMGVGKNRFKSSPWYGRMVAHLSTSPDYVHIPFERIMAESELRDVS